MSKLIGSKAFYKRVLLVTVPIMLQNCITNFVGLLDNIMVGRMGTEQLSGVAIANQLLFVFNLAVLEPFPVRVFLQRSFMARRITRVCGRPCATS